MSQKTITPDEKIGNAGVIDDQESYDLKSIQVAQPPPDPNAPKDVRVRVPAAMPDAYVHSAMNLGMDSIRLVSAGRLVIHFPSVTMDAKTRQPVFQIGKFEMLIAKPEDIERITKLAKVINEQNMRIAQSAHKPTEVLATTIEATRAKDEAVRQGIQAAGGEVPLVIAKEEPKGGIILGR